MRVFQRKIMSSYYKFLAGNSTRKISRSLRDASQSLIQNPSPVSPKGETARTLPQTKRWLGKLTTLSRRTEDKKTPSPKGEGQVNKPIMTLIRERFAHPKNYLNDGMPSHSIHVDNFFVL